MQEQSDSRITPPSSFAPIIGAAVPRIDGPLKTTGTATYTADLHLPEMVYAVPVCSTIAHGSIRSLDASSAEQLPGVLLVLHHRNIGPLFRIVPDNVDTRISEARPAFEDERIYYWGQYVALVVAVTLEQAQTAAAAVRVQYDEDKASVSPALNGPEDTPHIDSKRGDSEAAFSSAPFQIDQTYGTPVEAHNPMEMHATIAVWEGSKCTLYESSQGVITQRNAMAQVLGIPKENLQVISRYIGSGFGNKLYPWPHSALAAAAARRLNRPVKLTLSRKMMFSNVGHRARTVQRLRLGATADGKLLSLSHDYRVHASLIDDYKEGCGESTPFLYSVANLQVSSALVRRTVGTPTPMRGPGAVPGLFALESAMDELAIKLNLDPVELRLRNDTLIDEEKRKPFSSRHLKECLQAGAERFGWSKRTPGVGSMREGDLIVGWGVACAAWGAYRSPCQANVLLRDDGCARVSCAMQDIGTGSYTIFAQVVSEKTGIAIERIDVVLGDSSLAPGPRSGGSRATATVLPAIADAANAAIDSLLVMAVRTSGSPFEHCDPATLAMTAGRVHAKEQTSESGVRGVAFESLLRMAKVRYANGDGHSGGLGSDSNADELSTHSFGAHFAEVDWDPGIARLRVRRVVSVIDGGRIINRTTATNQIVGAVVMGVGMGLLEETIYDQRSGHPVTDNFADYIVPTHADVPAVDVTFLDHPDRAMGEYGARGIGEIGLAGVAPAITAAFYHATGVRVRELPVRVEHLLQARREA